MSFPILFLLTVLASYRITHALTLEDGPFRVFERLAKLAEGTILGNILQCFWCCSFWVSLAIAPFCSGNPIEHTLLWIVSALAISGVGGAVNELISLGQSADGG